VADSRLRIKGRFVTKEQAVAMLGGDGIYDLDKISSSEIKDLLNLKFGSSITKKKENSVVGEKDTKSKGDINECDKVSLEDLKDNKDLLDVGDLVDIKKEMEIIKSEEVVEKEEVKAENE